MVCERKGVAGALVRAQALRGPGELPGAALDSKVRSLRATTVVLRGPAGRTDGGLPPEAQAPPAVGQLVLPQERRTVSFIFIAHTRPAHAEGSRIPAQGPGAVRLRFWCRLAVALGRGSSVS